MPYWFDGNNLIGKTVAQAKIDREIRRAFLRLLSDNATARGGRLLVFFDGDNPDRSMPPRGVQVRYSAPLSADDAILQGLTGIQNPGEVIVVTNDSGLRTRCRNAGAKTMNWGEFTSVREKPGAVPQRLVNSEDPVNVDEWARYFGFDDDSLE